MEDAQLYGTIGSRSASTGPLLAQKRVPALVGAPRTWHAAIAARTHADEATLAAPTPAAPPLCPCSGRLFNEIRSREGLAYSVSGGWAPTPLDHPGLFAASAETAQPTALLGALRGALERAAEAPPSAEELQRAKQVGRRVRLRPSAACSWSMHECGLTCCSMLRACQLGLAGQTLSSAEVSEIDEVGSAWRRTSPGSP